MATINSTNNTLTSATGTGSFVGSASPTITALDAGGATTLKIPNSASPSLSNAGEIAIDTSITNFNGMLKYRDSSQTLLGVSIPTADLASPTNNYIIGYNSASSKLTLITQSSVTKIAGYASATSAADDTTTSTSDVDTSLTVSYTPTSASNLLIIYAYGAGFAEATANTNDRSSIYTLRRTTGTAADLSSIPCGRVSSVTDPDPATSYYNVAIYAQETAGSTSSHTYILRHRCRSSNETTTFQGTACAAFIIVMEMAV